MSATLVVAGRSARWMAEAAARDGCEVIALDVFGDADTRRAARRWVDVGDAALRIDAARLLPALAEAAQDRGVIGWMAGSDFECEPALLASAAAQLPLLGTAPDAVARVRDPARFFAALDALGLPHPEVADAPPADPRGWLLKDALGTGGWHIRRADDPHPADAARRPYWQRESAGQPMSALFIAAADGVQLVGFNALIVRPLGVHPHVYRGAIGPLQLPVKVEAPLRDAIARLAARFALRGLASLDFLLDGEHWTLLEINPRASASMALYAERPLVRAHLAACRGDAPVAVEGAGGPGTTRGHEIVFARQAFRLSPAQATMLAEAGDCHDLPAAGTAFAAGDPVCSIGALGNNADAVRAALASRRQALRDTLTPKPV
ncbi:ATP-grasp domain-containing protein [uncultured Methylibium sp.]|uniref:ATP-grasp domain-containing protein n=1 Tax=uncultured Methylibium sp. TaxID=381093 RepID=UPI0025E99156|nr:ATP-grasp domain-containing protein [uncultured Methylibium sp.]